MFAKKHSWLILFRTKILLLLLLVSMIPLVVSAGILYNRAVWSMKNQTADIAENSIRFETRIADSLIQAAEYFGNQYTEDRTLRRMCSDEGDLTGILAVFVKSELFENYYNEIQKGFSGNTIVTDTFDNILIASDENLAEAFSRHELFGRTTSEWNDVQLDGKEFILVSGALNNLDAIIYILIETD